MIGSILTVASSGRSTSTVLVLEMFLWDTEMGRKAFRMTPEFSNLNRGHKVLAANQGLYNGFLAAGLIWGIWLGEAGDPVKIFFLLCVAGARRLWCAFSVSDAHPDDPDHPALIALVAVIYM